MCLAFLVRHSKVCMLNFVFSLVNAHNILSPISKRHLYQQNNQEEARLRSGSVHDSLRKTLENSHSTGKYIMFDGSVPNLTGTLSKTKRGCVFLENRTPKRVARNSIPTSALEQDTLSFPQYW